MKSRVYFFILFSALTFSAQAQFNAVKKNLSQKPMQDRYVQFLEEKGYNPELDKDGDIYFTYNESRFYITLDVQDSRFFRVARIANLNLNSPEKISLAKEISHDVTKDMKVTKVYWSNGQIWASSEQLIGNPEDFKSIFDQTLSLTEKAYNKFKTDWQSKNK